jgi:hypothetical protein
LLRKQGDRRGYTEKLVEVKCHHLDVCHFFERMAHALSADAALFDAAVGHVIGAEGWDIVDDHAAEIQTLDRLPSLLNIASMMRRPTGGLPVKVTFAGRGSVTS